MDGKVRVGVIGTSYFTQMLHLKSLESHPRAEISAICGRNRDRAEELAVEYGIPQVFTDYREMIEQGNLDAVVVAAPDDLHFPMTIAALDAGLHVSCEKPLARTVDHAQQMLDKGALQKRSPHDLLRLAVDARSSVHAQPHRKRLPGRLI